MRLFVESVRRAADVGACCVLGVLIERFKVDGVQIIVVVTCKEIEIVANKIKHEPIGLDAFFHDDGRIVFASLYEIFEMLFAEELAV